MTTTALQTGRYAQSGLAGPVVDRTAIYTITSSQVVGQGSSIRTHVFAPRADIRGTQHPQRNRCRSTPTVHLCSVPNRRAFAAAEATAFGARRSRGASKNGRGGRTGKSFQRLNVRTTGGHSSSHETDVVSPCTDVIRHGMQMSFCRQSFHVCIEPTQPWIRCCVRPTLVCQLRSACIARRSHQQGRQVALRLLENYPP